MKYLLLVLCISFGFSLKANDTFTYTLEDHQKFESTISFDIQGESTVHILVVKNKDTKMYDLIPFLMDKHQKVTQLKTASFEKTPDLLSHHLNGQTLTLIGYQDKSLELLDYDLSNGSYTAETWEDYDKPVNVFRKNDKTLFLLPDNKKDSFVVTTVKNASTSSVSEIPIPEDYKKSVRVMKQEGMEVVSDEGYVQHSSIAKIQAYFNNGNFYLVEDVEFQNDLSVISINTVDKTVGKTDITTDGIEELKDNNSFIKDGKLFALLLGKKDFELRIHNLETGAEEKKFSLMNDLAGIREIKSKSAVYLKESNRFKNKPTVTVNITVNGNYKVNIDYVDKNSYRNFDNMWLLHHMMWQQQMMMMNAGGFGPNPDFDNPFSDIYFNFQSQAISLLLSRNLEILENSEEETRHKLIDKEKHMESLSKNKNIFNESAGFLEDEYRYMYTDKKENTVYIKVKSVKRREVPSRK